MTHSGPALICTIVHGTGTWLLHKKKKSNWEFFIISKDQLLSLVAHRFEFVEFRIFVVVFFRQENLKKSKQTFYILNSTRPNRWATKDILKWLTGCPFPMGLPRVTMSGTISSPWSSKAHHLEPTRPNPTWTSSAMHIPPAALTCL